MKAEILKVINECSVNPISNTSERIIHEDDFEYLADEINSLLSNKESEEEKDFRCSENIVNGKEKCSVPCTYCFENL